MSTTLKKPTEEVSFIRKCILMANLAQETDKVLLNNFSFMPVVKLYAAGKTQEEFIYSNIKGVLLFFGEKNKKDDDDTKKYCVRIYDYRDYSLKFSLDMNKFVKTNYAKLEEKFYYFTLNAGYFAFNFKTVDDAKKFYDIVTKPQSNAILEENKLSQNLTYAPNSPEVIKIIKELADKLRIQYKEIIKNEQTTNKTLTVEQILEFLGFDELYKLLHNIEYDQDDGLFNLFIDKNFNYFNFKNTFYKYDLKKIYPFRVIYNDYLCINNKSNYTDILIDHLINNFKELKNISITKRANRAKEKANELTASQNSGTSSECPNRTISNSSLYSNRASEPSETNNKDVIKEEPEEGDEDKKKGGIGGFFSKLNPF